MRSITINGTTLSLQDIYQVAQGDAKICIATEAKSKVDEAAAYLQQAVRNNEIIYGVTTNFGGLAQEAVNNDHAQLLQENLLWGLRCAIGKKLPASQVRAGMLIAANALLKGVSGIRFEWIERIICFLNARLTPVVYDGGSIGASGDLIPMSYVAGCISGLSAQYKVTTSSLQEIDAIAALNQLNLAPLKLQPKEGLALVNSTAMMTGIATHCVQESAVLLELSYHLHALFMLALQSCEQSLDVFVHAHKPHPGQIQVAAKMRHLITNTAFSRKTATIKDPLVQDRYAIRCMAQYMGVIADGLASITQQVSHEANSVTDNPLIDVANQRILHGGNFLGQYIGVGMDQLRYYVGLLVKHLDVQIAFLVAPEFNQGLPGSLAANNNQVKFGLKGLQICANSLMPRILHLANPIAPLYPTHAEQFNQNINSQGYASAILATQSLDLTRWYCAIALIFAVQAVELRCYQQNGHYDAAACLSDPLISLYHVIYQLVNKTNSSSAPLIWYNHQQALDEYVNQLYKDLQNPHGKILQAL